MKKIILLAMFVGLFSGASFAESADNSTDMDNGKYKRKLKEFLAECSEASVDEFSLQYAKQKNAISKKELMKAAKLTLKKEIPNSSEVLDEDFFSFENVLFSDLTDSSCEGTAEELFDDKIWQGAHACNKADQCGYVYKMLAILNGEFYTITFKSY